MEIRKVVLTERNVAKLDWLDANTFYGEKTCDKKGSHWWMVFDGDKAVGFAGLYPFTESMAYICRAGVLKPYRKQGLYRRLILSMEKAARKMGHKYIVTYTAHSNTESANALIKRGYKLYEPAQRYGFADAYYLRKEL